ncbi:MAG: zinc ABC transporter substrate-binding protein [Elusimicrobia bacterium]|nr:zinc ABC transporter substrate-binding protein [Elusimicrobiota bacterium]
MKTLVLAVVLLACPGFQAQARKILVVATTPELVDMTKSVGGDLVEVSGIARGAEDIHQVVMRPSFATKLNRADAVVYMGLTIEHSFLPGLLAVAANPRMASDWVRTCAGEGCIDCSEGVSVLEKPQTVSRAEGEIHPQGNPHYNLEPSQGPRMARVIAKGLSRIAPERAAEFQNNLKSYLAELEPKIEEWRRRAAPLKGLKAVSYHKDTAYLGRFTGIDFVDTVELKPGIAPTGQHIEALVKRMKEEDIKLIVREQQYAPKTCDRLAEMTGARVAVIGTMANALPGTETFAKFSEHNLNALLKATEGRP